MSPHFSFELVNALDYDELRPGYAPDAVAWVAERGRLAPGLIVIDLAAGTGQLSRRFMPLGVDLVAVEPAANMRAVLEERLPAVRVLEGTAESIPLEAGSVDAVVVGNAFHHFDGERAFTEIARVYPRFDFDRERARGRRREGSLPLPPCHRGHGLRTLA
jgi:SAM-dependent methyltransferase